MAQGTGGPRRTAARHAADRGLRVIARLTVASGFLALLGAFQFPPQAPASTRVVGAHSAYHDFPMGTAFDGGFLFAWEDGRGMPDRLPQGEGAWNFYARVSPTGVLLEPGGNRISVSAEAESDPSAACAGTSCLLVWQETTDGLRARALDAVSGQLGPEQQLYDMGSGWLQAQVTTLGTGFVTSWAHGDVLGRVLAADGTPTAATLTLGTSATSVSLPTALASNGATFLVAWVSNTSLMARVFDGAGTPLAAAVTVGSVPVSPTDSHAPTVVFGGGNYVVVWSNALERLAMRRISPLGVLVDATQRLPFGNSTGRTGVAVLADAASFVVAWKGSSTLELGRVAFDLTPQGGPTVVLVPPPGESLTRRVRLSPAQGGQALILWSETAGSFPPRARAGLLDLTALTVSSTGLADLPIADIDLPPRATQTSSGFLVGWVSTADFQGLPLVRPLDWTGAPSGVAQPLDVAGALSVDLWSTAEGPRAVWATQTEVKTSFLSAAGAPVGTATLVATEDTLFEPRVAALPPQSLVVWSYDRVGTGYGLAGRLLGADGGMGPVLGFATSPSYRVKTHDIAASSTQYALAWADPPSGEVLLQRVAPDGTLLGAPTDLLYYAGIGQVAIASDGADFLVVWNDQYPSVVSGVRVNAAGTLLDPIPLVLSAPEHSTLGEDLSFPEVTFDGTDYRVVWSERLADGGALDVRLRKVARDGGIGPSELVFGGPGNQHSASVLFQPAGRGLVSLLDSDEAGDKVNRVKVVAFAELAPGQSCLSRAECVAGACLSGVCCALAADGGCVVDAGSPDAGVMDAGALDGAVDAGATDAGALDGAVDAGMADAGAADAGDADAGSADAGAADGGGVFPDALSLHVGCDCSSAGNSLWFVIAGFTALARGRRRRARGASKE